MSLHPGMEYETKTGEKVVIVRVEGNHLYIKNYKGNYYYIQRN